MNFYIMVGIILIAFGTGIMVYGLSIIIGILLNAFGTGIMVYGQLVKSRVDNSEVSRELQGKVDNVLKRIDEIREEEKDEASARKINRIEQEFKDWAAEFLKNRELKKVQLARTELDSVDAQLRVSNEWRPIFEYILQSIDSLARAYNAESGESVKIDFPPIPPNLYSDEASNYGGKVIFPNKVIWDIEFLSIKPPRERHPPSMHILFQKIEENENLRPSFFTIQYFDGKSFHAILGGPSLPTAEGIEGVYPLDSYRDSIKTIMRRLFEAQLLQD